MSRVSPTALLARGASLRRWRHTRAAAPPRPAAAALPGGSGGDAIHGTSSLRHVAPHRPFGELRVRTASGRPPAATSQRAPPPDLAALAAPGGVWSGLEEWRTGALNRRWVWGKTDCAEPSREGDNNAPAGTSPPGPWAYDYDAADFSTQPLPPSLAQCADLILRTADPATKAMLSHRTYARFTKAADSATPFPIGTASPPAAPARPARPLLVPPKEVWPGA